MAEVCPIGEHNKGHPSPKLSSQMTLESLTLTIKINHHNDYLLFDSHYP